MFDWIFYAISITVIIALSFSVIKRKKRELSLLTTLLQLEIEKQALKNEVAKLTEAQSIDQSDGFLKFLSQSRDWAFNYIEEVQAALKKFDSVVSPNLEYAKTYGKVTGESPNSAILDKIDEAYSELTKVLPQDK
jgi:hypothetical protein